MAQTEEILDAILAELRLIRAAIEGESRLSPSDQRSLTDVVAKSKQLADAVASAVHKSTIGEPP
jgi:hypothetical protein